MIRLRPLAVNALSMVTSNVVIRGTTFLLYVLVARYLGVDAFGQLALGLALAHSFRLIPSSGMQSQLVRSVARRPQESASLFYNYSAVVFAMALATLLAQAVFVWCIGYSAATTQIVMLLALGVVPFCMSRVCESVLQAWERMHLIAIAQTSINLVQLVGALELVLAGYGIQAIGILIVSGLTLLAAVGALIVLAVMKWPRVRFDLSAAGSILRESATFFGIALVQAARAGMIVALLSIFADERAVGLFSAARQLLVPMTLLFESIALSVFPVFCKQSVMQDVGRVAEFVIELLLALSLPAVVLLTFYANGLLTLIYGSPDFSVAVPVAQILAWILIAKPLSAILGQVLMAGSRERVNLRIVTVSAVVMLLVGPPLINGFGVQGAALTALVSLAVNVVYHYVAAAALVGGISLRRNYRPLVAASGMAAAVLLLAQHHDLVSFAMATCVYLGVFIALAIRTPDDRELVRAVLAELRGKKKASGGARRPQAAAPERNRQPVEVT